MESDKEHIWLCFLFFFSPKEKCCWCTQNYLWNAWKIL